MTPWISISARSMKLNNVEFKNINLMSNLFF